MLTEALHGQYEPTVQEAELEISIRRGFEEATIEALAARGFHARGGQK